MASAGLGSSYVIMSRARKAWWFFVAAAVDGLTSCMLSQVQKRTLCFDCADIRLKAQALVADNQPAESNLSIALSKFQVNLKK